MAPILAASTSAFGNCLALPTSRPASAGSGRTCFLRPVLRRGIRGGAACIRAPQGQAPHAHSRSVTVGAVSTNMSDTVEENTWPDGCFRGSWPTKDCPPNPRPDIYAPPVYHGEPSHGPGERVQVRVYMIDRFGLSRVGRAVLRKEFDAIWHVGVVAFGREYNFADKVAYMDLDNEDIEGQSMHGFAPSHVYEVGNTMKTREELDHLVFSVLPEKYCINRYCSFTNNCHNFSDDLVQFLVNKKPEEGGFPQWCLNHGGKALSNLPDADADTIRLASNKIAKVMMVSFGKFNRERMKIMDGLEWTAVESEELDLSKEDVESQKGNVRISEEARN